MIKKVFTSLLVILYFSQICLADLHFGVPSGVRRKITELKEKIENKPPVINSLVANPTTLSPGGISTITCIASDPDGDVLTYSWTATGGTISGSGSQVTWTAPLTEGVYTITCTVSDGKGGSAQSSVNVSVVIPEGTKKWEFITGGWVVSSPAIGADGTIYVGSLDFDKKLYAINPDGTKKWEFLTGAGVFSSPAVGPDGTIYVGSRDNKLYAINPNGTKKWEFLTGDWVRSSPAIGSDGTIYVGSKNKLYAIKGSGRLADTPWPKFRQNLRNTGRRE